MKHIAHKWKITNPVGRQDVRSVLAMCFLALGIACSDSDAPVAAPSNDATPGMLVEPPAVLSHRMIDKSTLRLRYSVNGGPIQQASPLMDGSGSYVAIAEGSSGTTLFVSFTWYQASQDGDLPLATLDVGPFQVSSQEQVIDLQDAVYVTDAKGMDDDGDGFYNLDELRIGTNPFNSNSCKDCPKDIDLVIRKIGSDYPSPPVIDAAYDGDIWTNNAQFKDQEGRLFIDSLMIGSDSAGAALGYRWGSMHDGANLYLIVFGRAGVAERFSDSLAAVDDESLEVFIGADPQGNNAFYGADDYHLIIPLISQGDSANQSGLSFARIERGPNSAFIPMSEIEYATCLCSGDRDIWELKIPLHAVGVSPGDIFGIELQVNLDVDGGPRDAKWGWKHPERTTVDIDYTVSNPMYMGRALLEN